MSKLDDLILDFCPEGVRYMQLGAMEDAGLIKLGRGNVISKKDIAADPGDYPIYSSSASGVGEFGRYGKFMFDDERLSWSVDGGGRFFYRHAHKYSVTNVSGWLNVLDSDYINIKYLFYALDSAWSTKKFNYTKKAHPSIIRNEYKIPIPPLAVQKEIVTILDKFTQLEAELSAKLSAELNARQKQYGYYRSQLFTFDESQEKVRWLTLDDVCKSIGAGGDLPKKFKKGQLIPSDELPYPIFSNGSDDKALYGYTDGYKIDEEAVSISARGTIGFHAIRPPKFTPIVRLLTLIPDNNTVTTKYLNYALDITEIGHSGGSIPQLTVPNVKKIKIPVPSISEQNRITDILDKFEVLTNNIYEVLPAEIIARRKQYEYYRTKLLTFQELPA